MSIISQKTWDNMPREEKALIRKNYMMWQEEAKTNPYFDGKISNMETLFGTHNLEAETIAEKCVKPIKVHFDMQTQDIEWNKCTKQEQENILEIYNNHPEWEDVINALEDKFGKHNLQPKPKIKTWEDMVKQYPHFKDDIDKLERDILYGWNKLREKLIACYKIAKLIEIAYGGMVNEEEYDTKVFYNIVANRKDKKIELNIVSNYDAVGNILTFRSYESAYEFMSYPENVELIKQYYMI